MDPLVRRAAVVLGAVAAVGAAVLACAEGLGPGGRGRVRLTIVPVFSETVMELLSGDLDRLHIRIRRLPSGPVVADTTVAVDSSGNVDLNLAVPLTAETESFEVLLEGIRSSDGVVLYTGLSTVAVSSTGTPAPAEVPVTYVGPCQKGSGCTITVGPQDRVLNQGDSVQMTVTVDSAGVTKSGVPVSLTVLTPSLVATSNARYVRALTGTPGGPAKVVASIRDDADTLRVFVAPPGGTPARVIVTPGYAALRLTAPNNTVQLADTVKDLAGNLLSPGLATWVSRNTAVATVSSTGLVTAAGRGTAVIVATAGASDSILVTVGNPAGAGDAIALAVTNGRSFGARRVGDSVYIDVIVSHVAVPSDSLGSYNARFTFNTAALQYDTTSAGTAGTFSPPTVNKDSASAGVIRFAAADANGKRGTVTLYRLKFRAIAAQQTNHALTFSDMTAARTFTNMLPRLLVAAGAATITP